MSSDFNDYRLGKWRRLILVRDSITIQDRRLAACVLCRRVSAVWALQVHHIRPKSLYPERAYELANGVTLCTGCHMGIIHAGNSFYDVGKLDHWRRFVPMFDRWVELADNERFNVHNQERV